MDNLHQDLIAELLIKNNDRIAISLGVIDRLKKQNAEFITVLEKIANLPPRSTAGPSIARSALDTMKALEE